MVGGEEAGEAEAAAVAEAEAMPEEEDLVEGIAAEVGAKEAKEPQPLTPMTQAGATLHRSGEA